MYNVFCRTPVINVAHLQVLLVLQLQRWLWQNAVAENTRNGGGLHYQSRDQLWNNNGSGVLCNVTLFCFIEPQMKRIQTLFRSFQDFWLLIFINMLVGPEKTVICLRSSLSESKKCVMTEEHVLSNSLWDVSIREGVKNMSTSSQLQLDHTP